MADLNMVQRNTQTDSAPRHNPQWQHFHYVHYFLGIRTRKAFLAPDGIIATTNPQHSALSPSTAVTKTTLCNRRSRHANESLAMHMYRRVSPFQKFRLYKRSLSNSKWQLFAPITIQGMLYQQCVLDVAPTLPVPARRA